MLHFLHTSHSLSIGEFIGVSSVPSMALGAISPVFSTTSSVASCTHIKNIRTELKPLSSRRAPLKKPHNATVAKSHVQYLHSKFLAVRIHHQKSVSNATDSGDGADCNAHPDGAERICHSVADSLHGMESYTMHTFIEGGSL